VVRFSDDDGFDFAIRCLLNGVPYGMADPGEVFAATADVLHELTAGDVTPRLERFTTAEGAELDCEIGAPVVRATRIADWLDDTVGHERSRG
jgi:hypothetical protein